MSTAELFDALQALVDPQEPSNRGLLKELEVHQLELEIQNRELRQTQQQLSHSRTRYADLYDFSPIGYVSLDENGHIEEINITGGKLLGENPHRLVGRSFADFIPEPDVQAFMDHLRRCRRSRQKRTVELRLRTSDGSLVDVQLFTMATQDVDRHQFEFRTALLNITSRRRAEEALRQIQLQLEDRISERTKELTASHNLLDAVINKAQDFIYAKDLEGRYLMINTAGAELIGRPAEDIVGMSDLDCFPHETAGRLMKTHQQLLHASTSLTFEVLIGTNTGSPDRWFQLTAGPYHDHSGNVVGVVGISRDITDRRQREDAQRFLNEASAVLSASLDYEITLWNLARAAIPHLADACVVDLLQEDGSVRRMSVAHTSAEKEPLLWDLETAGGRAESSAGSLKVINTAQPELHDTVSDSLLSKIAANAKQLESFHTLKPTSLMWVPLVVRGETIGSLGFLLSRADRRYNLFDLALAEDLADRAAIALDNARLYSREQEANRLKDEFLAMVSHELRTPLTPILGAIYMLRTSHRQDQDLRIALDLIERNAKTQARIVEDLLDISRITTGSLDFKMAPTDLLPIVERAVEVIRPAAESLGIHLTTSFEKPRDMIWCDRDRIQQVIWNLLSNAIKFTRQDGTINVSLQNTDRAARIRISDTGIGIRREFLPHVFERFRQAGTFSTRTHGGLGVGLAIVRYIVERHGGTVRAESAGEGKGTTFTVDLPYK